MSRNFSAVLLAVVLAACGSSGGGGTQPAEEAQLPMVTGLTVAPGDGVNVVSWDAVEGAASYNLYWDTEPGVAPERVADTDSNFSPLLEAAAYSVSSPLQGEVAEGRRGISEHPHLSPPPSRGRRGYTVPSHVADAQDNSQRRFSPFTRGSGSEGTEGVDHYLPGGFAATPPYKGGEHGLTQARAGNRVEVGANTSYTHEGLRNGVTYYYLVTAVSDSGMEGEYDADNGTAAGAPSETSIPGCTNHDAENYNPNATADDGSCVIRGCTDRNATNYDPGATHDDGTCEYPSDDGGTTDPPPQQNHNPVLTVYNKTCTENSSCSGTVAACTDPDGDSTSISLSGGPSYLSKNGGSVSGTPSYDEVQHPSTQKSDSMTATCSDGKGGQDQKSLTITTNDVNRNCYATGTPDTSAINIGDVFGYTMGSVDPDGDLITHVLIEPTTDVISFNSSNGELVWSPLSTGNYTIDILGTDDYGGSCETIFNKQVNP